MAPLSDNDKRMAPLSDNDKKIEDRRVPPSLLTSFRCCKRALPVLALFARVGIYAGCSIVPTFSQRTAKGWGSPQLFHFPPLEPKDGPPATVAIVACRR
jgi:hypothetical protein